jgi:anti-sigma factor RsiW
VDTRTCDSLIPKTCERKMVEYPPGWTCRLTELRLEYYILGTLPWPEALAVAEHLEACIPCSHLLVLWERRERRA